MASLSLIQRELRRGSGEIGGEVGREGPTCEVHGGARSQHLSILTEPEK